MRIALVFLIALIFCPTVIGQQYYGLAIGVNRYNGDFAPLRYAERDAQGVGEALKNIGYKVVTMGHDQPSGHLDPTNADKILQQIRHLADSGRDGDTLVLFMSGHGCQFPDDPETYFCPSDANLNKKDFMVRVSEVMKILSGSEATHRFVLLDACQEEIFARGTPKNAARRIQIPNLVDTEKVVPKTLAVFFSCSPKQLSFEDPELPNSLDPMGEKGHGIFSHYVIQYLTGQAGDQHYTERDELSVSLMENFVSTATRQHAQKLNRDQIPKLKFDGSFSLGRLPRQANPSPVTSADSKIAGTPEMSKPASATNKSSLRVRSRIGRSAVYQNRSTFDSVDHRVGIEAGTEVAVIERDKTTKRLYVEWLDIKGIKRRGWIDDFSIE